jgi:CheY-like chemotaxis protein
MGGTLSLDESYNSGVPGCPGTRITFSLKAVSPRKKSFHQDVYLSSEFTTKPSTADLLDNALTLPEGLSILFVDDDTILRKLFSRVVKSVAPTSIIRQASNGETALVLTETESFDIIFMDMYMASVEKQLLGTETVVELRAKGVTSCICGLSANDKESEFIEAGADFFVFKPFPCEQKEVTRTLLKILHSRDYKQ